MSIGTTPKISKRLVLSCFKGIQMLSFKEWLAEEAKKPKKKKEDKDVKSTNQGSTEVGNVYHQGQTSRPNQEVQPAVVHYFPEP
jgi:hypothetical protein